VVRDPSRVRERKDERPSRVRQAPTIPTVGPPLGGRSRPGCGWVRHQGLGTRPPTGVLIDEDGVEEAYTLLVKGAANPVGDPRLADRDLDPDRFASLNERLRTGNRLPPDDDGL
jgi:hypothetical protein